MSLQYFYSAAMANSKLDYLKRVGKVSQEVWSTAIPLFSLNTSYLLNHGLGAPSNNKLIDGPVAEASGALVFKLTVNI